MNIKLNLKFYIYITIYLKHHEYAMNDTAHTHTHTYTHTHTTNHLLHYNRYLPAMPVNSFPSTTPRPLVNTATPRRRSLIGRTRTTVTDCTMASPNVRR